MIHDILKYVFNMDITRKELDFLRQQRVLRLKNNREGRRYKKTRLLQRVNEKVPLTKLVTRKL